MPDSAAHISAQTPSPARSVSRGRDAFTSSGRGGLGNIRCTLQDPASPSPVRDPRDPDYLSPVRGREATAPDHNSITSIGRGGLGNIRSPSRDPTAAENASKYEESVIRASEEAVRTGVYSSGRGGLGNMHSPRGAGSPHGERSSILDKARSLSRSRSRPPVHTTGRGGAGNFAMGDKIESELVDIQDITEAEKARKAHAEGLHSTGRGGAANITALSSPHSPSPPLSHTGAKPVSAGRGGAGNIRSPSREGSRARGEESGSRVRGEEGRSRSKQREHKLDGLGELWDRVTHQHGRKEGVEEGERGRAREPVNGEERLVDIKE